MQLITNTYTCNTKCFSFLSKGSGELQSYNFSFDLPSHELYGHPVRIYPLPLTTTNIMAGVDLVTLVALLGHSRVQMVMRYAHPVEEHKIEAVKKFERFNSRIVRAGS